MTQIHVIKNESEIDGILDKIVLFIAEHTVD